MDKWKKGLVLLLGVALMGTAVVALQYVRTTATMTFTIKTTESAVQFMAFDGSPSDAGYVLKNSACAIGAACGVAADGGSYQIRIGTWMVGAIKTFTAALAVVNTEPNFDLELYSAPVDTADAGYTALDVYVHPDPWSNCAWEFGVSSNESADCQTFVANGTAGAPAGWTLNNGTGSYTTAAPFPYGQMTSSPECIAVYEASLGGVYRREATGAGCPNTEQISVEGTSNHVWVQVVMDSTGLAAGAYSVDVNLNFRAV